MGVANELDIVFWATVECSIIIIWTMKLYALEVVLINGKQLQLVLKRLEMQTKYNNVYDGVVK